MLLILGVAVSCTVLAQEKPNCDRNLGLIDGSCHKPRVVPWWKCEENTYLTPQERGVTREQQRRLEDFGAAIFSPPDFEFSRDGLVRRFGQPLKVRSTEVLGRDVSD